MEKTFRLCYNIIRSDTVSFLYLLETIRTGFLDSLMLFITAFGEEAMFIVIGMLFFWCVDKYEGYYILLIGFMGTVVNQFLKILCRIERPWVRDPEFQPVGGSKEAATGYSFPSGHTQSSVGSFGAVARWSKNRAVQTVCLVLCVLVPFSRMYLGVHTPADVLSSVGIALVLVFALYPLVTKAKDNRRVMWGIIGFSVLISAALLLYVTFFKFPADIDTDNYNSALKNAYTLVGCVAGFAAVYYIDEYHIRFETAAVWWVQIIKLVVGIALVLGVKEGLRLPLDTLFASHPAARSVRYFLVVLIGGGLWPAAFKWLNRLAKLIKEEI